MRAPLQVLVLPYRWNQGTPEYAIFKVVDGEYWQFVAGGSEDDEIPLEAARRECLEESGLEGELLPLDSMTTIPKYHYYAAKDWGEEIFVVAEYAFGLAAMNNEIVLSQEHLEYRWVRYEEGVRLLKWDSNKSALWELDQRLK